MKCPNCGAKLYTQGVKQFDSMTCRRKVCYNCYNAYVTYEEIHAQLKSVKKRKQNMQRQTLHHERR